jgi:osmoprotectant transport system permease protein
MTEAGFLSRVVEWFTDPAQWSGPTSIQVRFVEHVTTSGVAVAIAAAVALPVALYIGHRRRFELMVISVANLGRAVPSFGLLVLFVILFGLRLNWPASLRPSIILALVLLAIPPILTNTYVGIQGVDPDLLEASRGMGMAESHVLRRIEVPLAAPLIVAGLRIAAVQVVATATLAALVAGGGFGRYIVDGFAAGDRVKIFAGALLVAILAILTELAFGILQRAVTPRTMSLAEVRLREVHVRPPPVMGPAA